MTNNPHSESKILVAMELSNSKWMLAFTNGQKVRRKSIEARDRGRFLQEVALAKEKLGFEADATVLCCYEAGRDGFWIYRWLVPTPYNSGDSVVEQGISKAGNPRIRKTMVELAWCWVRFQPESELTNWFIDRYAGGSSRQRRVGIVALARKLLVALWKYVEFGTIPKGAIIH